MQINVNGEIIPNEVFQAELQNATQANQGANPEDVKQLTLHRIVEWTLIRQEAKKKIFQFGVQKLTLNMTAFVSNTAVKTHFSNASE